MIIAIILAITVFVIFLYYGVKNDERICFYIITSLQSSVSIGFIIIVLSTIPNYLIPKDQKRYSETTHKIVSLKDNNNIKGSFFLGTGYVNNELYYYYLEETNEGLIEKEIEASKCHIKYSENPRVVEYSQTGYKNNYHYIYATPIGEPNRYTLYIPKGSITNEFENIEIFNNIICLDDIYRVFVKYNYQTKYQGNMPYNEHILVIVFKYKEEIVFNSINEDVIDKEYKKLKNALIEDVTHCEENNGIIKLDPPKKCSVD